MKNEEIFEFGLGTEVFGRDISRYINEDRNTCIGSYTDKCDGCIYYRQEVLRTEMGQLVVSRAYRCELGYW